MPVKVVKILARKKKEEGGVPAGTPAPWMATFSDLMNLLLCFFVLLFAMSSVDEAKLEELANVLSSRLSFFDGGQTSIGEGQLISTGAAQLTQIDQYVNSMGQTSEDKEGDEPYDRVGEAVEEANEEETEKMYNEVSEYSSEYNLDGYIDIGVDEKAGRYITIEISGNYLYPSGSAQLTNDALPIFSRVGDILKKYDGYRIAVIGHTDNVPVQKGGKYDSNMELSSARASVAAKYLIDNKGIDPENIEWVGKGEYVPIADNSTELGRTQNRRIEIRVYNSLNSN